MKKVWKSILLITLIFGMMVFIPAFMDSILADDATYSDGTIPGPGGSTTPTVSGSSLLILEIVPYKGMAEIGYLVGGQEPVDEALFNKDTAAGSVSFLGGAITAYKSYTVKNLPASSTEDSGWVPIQTYASQNGYFQYVGNGNGTYQKKTGQTVYSRVTDGTGNYNAKLDTENTNIYTGDWGQTNYKNVKAYFTYGTSSGASLYNTTIAYTPISVTRNANHTGDYDYNTDTAVFELNKGKGEYDVLFAQVKSASKLYYMRNDYQIVDDCSGDYSWNLTYVPATKGNYIMNTNGMTFTYTVNDRSNCAYNFVPDNGALTRTSYTIEGTPGTSSEKIWIQSAKIVTLKQYNFKVTMVNNEWFKRFSLGLTNEQCKKINIQVVTMTPVDLNKPENQHYLNEANIFYINDNASHNNAYMSLYENYSYEGLSLKTNQKYAYLNANNMINFGFNDLSWANTMKVYNRIAGVRADGSLGGYRAAVVFDNTYYQHAVAGSDGYGAYNENVNVSFNYNNNGASVCNLAKLYIMVYQRDAVDFYHLFISPSAPFHITQVSSTRNKTGTTGSFVRPDSTATSTSIEATFWNANTFLPYCFDANGNVITPIHWTDEGKAILNQEIPNFNITAQTTDMISNVLTLNGMDIFTSKFIEPLYNMPSDAIEAAKLYLNSIGVTPSSNLSIFSYIMVTSDCGTGYGSGTDVVTGNGEDGTSGSNLRTYTSILNIEPTADFKASETKIKQMLDGYHLKITNMTSMQFNSSIEDVNTHYDMVYIGGGFKGFNTNTVNGVTSTTFNTDSLNGSVYHTGDSVITTTGTNYYTGNDLTTQKIAELNDFLSAGFPIVMEDNLYRLTNAVQNTTNLYAFIQSAKAASDNSSRFLNGIDYTNSRMSFMVKLTTALKIERPQIRMVKPTPLIDAPVNYIYVGSDNLLNIEFAVIPNGLVDDSSIYYNAYLYMDYNGDGIFSSDELLNEVYKDGASSKGFQESFFKSHMYSYNMEAYNGVYQWKVKVVRQKYDSGMRLVDSSIRSEITGYAAVSHPKPIKVLQIIDNPASDPSAYSLQTAAASTSGLIRTYIDSSKVTEYNIQFTTMTVDQFANLYSGKPYATATAATMNQLANYHLLIMDNQINAIPTANGVRLNIFDEINKGMAVIFTKGSINYTNQLDYLSKPLFVNQKTYSYLSYMARPTLADPYYIYNFSLGGYTKALLQTDTTYQTNKISKTNEGPSSEYPYRIDDTIGIASNNYSEDAVLNYNLAPDINANPPLIGWFCLSDTQAAEYKGIYSSSPNDTKNNYYLFNQGSVFYSGIQLGKADVAGNDAEIKLFVNTILASYRSSSRVVSAAPVITITSPSVVDHVITLTKADVGTRTVIPVTFTITDSTSNMKLSILWDDTSKTTDDPTVTSGNWNKKIYRVNSDGTQTVITDLTNVTNGTYILQIPVDDLKGEHLLTMNAVNIENRSATLNTTVHYNAEPPTVTIDNKDLVKNVDKGEQYLYIDIDYATVDDDYTSSDEEKSYLSGSSDIRLEFTIGNTTDNVSVTVTDSDGNDITVTGSKLYSVTDTSTSYALKNKSVPQGSYYVDIPASIMSGVSNKEVTVTAEADSTTKGSQTVILLRRSLFRLD